MRPIPRKLLIHTATLKTSASIDAFQKPTHAETALTCVRIEPSNAVIKTKDNTEITLSAVLFYDCTNSLPKGTDFALESKIVFGGEERMVKSVERFYDHNKLHHLEIGLV